MGLDAPNMNPLDTLMAARAQFVLSQYTTLAYCFGLQGIDIDIKAVYLGPYSIDIKDTDLIRGAWSAEKIATQNLAVSLDSYLEASLGNKRLRDEDIFDFCKYVRCLRNAFAHNPYSPKWVLTDKRYRRCMYVLKGWCSNLRDRHETPVLESDYRYASGLLHLVQTGINIVNDKGVAIPSIGGWL